MAEITIAVMGATGTGKTTFVNVASASSLITGSGLRSCTDLIQESNSFYLDGRRVTLVDTPGFDDTTQSDAEILHRISDYLSKSYEEGKKLSGIIYVHRISDFRVGGISRRNFKMFREICGRDTLANVIILTNMWGQVSQIIGEQREAELADGDLFFKSAISKGAKMMRHDGSCDSAQRVLRQIIGNHPLPLQIQREMVDQKKNVAETSAGTELTDKMLLEEQKRNREEAERLRRETEDAINTKAEELRRIAEEDAKRLEEIRQEAEARAQALERERTEAERKAQEAAEQARQEAAKAAAEYQRQTEELQQRIQQAEKERQAQEEELRAAQERWAAEEARKKNPFEEFGKNVDEGLKWFGGEVGRTFGWW